MAFYSSARTILSVLKLSASPCAGPSGLLSIGNVPVVQIPVRTIAKHWNPKWKKHRGAKVIKPELPKFNEEREREKLSLEEMKADLKKRKVQPVRLWNERTYTITSTSGVFEPYVPPEGDGKMSAVSVQGAKQKFELLEKKSKSMMAVRKIRNFDEDFNTNEFEQRALEIYIAAHEAMANKDRHKLRDNVTEKAYPEMRHNTLDKTIHWKFHGNLEPPRVVHARCTDLVSKDNIFAQITLRLHTQQSLCIWDRFGRLEYGAVDSIRDVLEYIVFEKHLSNQYGIWRLHDKIIPDWLPQRSPTKRTFIKPIIEEEPIEDTQNNEEQKEETSPAVATA